MTSDEIKSLLEENLKLSKEIQATSLKIRRYMKIRMILGIIWIILILAPIILALIWLPPFLEQNLGPIFELLNGNSDLFKNL